MITQNDVRQIQLAKAALYAGCALLMERYGIERVDRIRLAGAFGTHIDPVHALVLGLVPDCEPERVTAAGNAAGTGARIALLNRAARAEIEDVVRRVEKVETAVEPRFQEFFVQGDGDPARRRPVRAAGADGPPPGAPNCSERSAARASSREEDRVTETRGRRVREAARRGRLPGCAPSSRACRSSPARWRHSRSSPKRGLALLEENADTILEQVGIDFRDAPDAIALFRDAGAEIDGERVRFPRGMCRQLVQATAPREFTQVARNPERNVVFGGQNTIFAPAYGSPFVRDLDNGRRYGTIEDFRNFVKLAYVSPWLHHSGGTVCEPVDLPVNKRHYDMVEAHLRLSDKPFMGSVTHPQRARDTVDMARIVFGADFLEQNTVVFSLINANSPLVWDATMLGAARAYAEANQAVMMTPFILAGAMSPATVAATCAQTLAESLAGMTYVQLVRPGAPVVLGSFASSMSMQSGAPTFGTPEPALVLYVMASLARRLGVPFRSGGALTASKIPDAQAAYESANTMQPTMLGGTNFVLHAAGWLEGGLAMGYEKFVLDADQLGMWHAFSKGVDLSRERAGARRLPHERARHALPRARAHARELRDRVLPLPARGQLELRAVGVRRSAATPPSARTPCGSVRSRSTSSRRSTTPSTTELREWIERQEGVVPGLGRMSEARAEDARSRAARLTPLRGASVRERRGGRPRARPARRHAHRHASHRGRASSTRSTSPRALTKHGYSVVPHLSARLVRDRVHLAEIIHRVDEIDAHDVFVVAGDADEPAGEYAGAAAAPRGDRRARAPLRERRDHGLPREPPVHRRRDHHSGDVRQGALRHVHRRARSASTRASRSAGSSASGTAERACRSSSVSRAPSRERSFSASRRRSASERRCASCGAIEAG